MGAKSGRLKRLKPRTIEELRNICVEFTTEEIQEWYNYYKARLKPGQTELTKDQFIEAYDSVFEGDAADFAENVFRSFDENKNGTVDFREFVVGLSMSGSSDFQIKLKWAFTMYDVNGDGFITKDEIYQIIKAYYKMMNCKTPSAEQLTEDLFKLMDCNQDGMISPEEFVKGVSQDDTMIQMLQAPSDEG